jgi:hypothetical protein
MKTIKGNGTLSKQFKHCCSKGGNKVNNNKSTVLFENELKVFTPKWKFDFGKQKKKEVICSVEGNISVDKVHNNNNSNNNTSRVYSSSNGYWENREERNKEKIERIRKEREMKEMNEMKDVPHISKRSKEIAQKLKNESMLCDHNATNKNDMYVINTEGLIKEKQMQVIHNKNNIKRKRNEMNNNNNNGIKSNAKLSTSDTMYLSKRIQMIQEEEMKRKEEENNNCRLKSLLDEPKDNVVYINEEDIIAQGNINDNINLKQQQQPKGSLHKYLTVNNNNNNNSELRKSRQKLNEYYNMNKRVNNHACNYYSQQNTEPNNNDSYSFTNYQYHQHAQQLQPHNEHNNYNPQQISNSNRVTYSLRNNPYNNNDYIYHQQIRKHNTHEQHSHPSPQDKPPSNTVINNNIIPSQECTKQHNEHSHQCNNYSQHDDNNVNNNNNSYLNQLEQNQRASYEFQRKILNNLSTNNPNSYSSYLINNNPTLHFREENNKRLQDLQTFKNNFNQQPTNQQYIQPQYLNDIKSQIAVTYIDQTRQSNQNKLDYLNQRLKLNETKKQNAFNQQYLPFYYTQPQVPIKTHSKQNHSDITSTQHKYIYNENNILQSNLPFTTNTTTNTNNINNKRIISDISECLTTFHFNRK